MGLLRWGEGSRWDDGKCWFVIFFIKEIAFSMEELRKA